MFDKRLRPSVEQKLRPVGANLRKKGISADQLTLLGLVMAVGAAVAIAAGALRVGFLLLILTAVPDVLDGAVRKPPAPRHHGGPSSTRSRTGSRTRCCSAGWRGTSATRTAGTSWRCRSPCWRCH